EVDLGLALALGDDPRAGRDALAACRDAVVVRDARGRVVGEGRLVERRLAGPFEGRVEGRVVARHAWVTTVRGTDGVARAYVDVAPAEGEARFHVVEGDRPPAGRVPESERTLTLEGRRDPRVVLGLERATWAVWVREGDRRLLATAALPDVGAARALLAGQRPGGWRRLAASLPGEPLDLDLRRWDADLRLLEVKLALERWDEVASDLHLRALLGGPPVPPALEERLAAIRRALAARR
ncbi:MAG: hypothetical protein KF878_32630, partial [Planctomycetes bacterium]|nr:hypothetical protein [Planctomycetota bacterium]